MVNNGVVLEKEQEEALQQVTAPVKPVYEFIKRMLDFLCAVFAIAVLLIPMVMIAGLIRLESEGPAVFRQERMGRNGKVFTIYKFRTMYITAPRDLASRELPDNSGYLTRIGAVLRKTSIDELPQLWNVLTGDMSIIGYRPLCLTETHANEMRLQNGVFRIRPGITGWAQVNGRNDITDEEKVRLDTEYLQNLSLKMDVLCLLKTVTTVLSGEGNA